MRQVVIAVLAVTLGSAVSFGQLSPDEARAKLEQKRVERAAATSRPSTLTQGQVDQLLAQIETLRAQVVQLRADNESLRKKLAAKGAETKPAKPQAGGPDSTQLGARLFTKDRIAAPIPKIGDPESVLVTWMDFNKYARQVRSESASGKVVEVGDGIAWNGIIFTLRDGKIAVISEP